MESHINLGEASMIGQCTGTMKSLSVNEGTLQ
jgi:hypothetical protein